MDDLKSTIQNISLYDVKAYVRKAQNVVMNYTETEAKVREATNNEPWGASSTLMQEIADGTNSYGHFHEIMPMIYKRFTEKTAEEWRQIYKALQLLEFLVKNGSERVVDYARSHASVIDMLKHFHYIDHNGKDQGINIRNRAKELNLLLTDVDRIRTERKKAKSNKQKYSGMGNGGFGGTGLQYGGFGSDSMQFGGGYENRVFGDGGGFNGSNYTGPGYSNDEDFEEYEVEGAPSSRASASAASASTSRPKPPAKPEPVPDIISFDDDDFDAPQTAPTQSKAKAKATDDDDDEFDDFQSATSAAPAQSTKNQITDLFNNTPQNQASPLQQQQQQQPQQQSFQGLGGLGGLSMQSTNTPPPPLTSPGSNVSTPLGFPNAPTPTSSTMATTSSTSLGSTSTVSQSSTAPKKSDDAFGSLWSAATSKDRKPAAKPQDKSKLPLSSLAQQNAQNSMWGSSSQNGNNNNNNNNNNQQDDLLI